MHDLHCIMCLFVCMHVYIFKYYICVHVRTCVKSTEVICVIYYLCINRIFSRHIFTHVKMLNACCICIHRLARKAHAARHHWKYLVVKLVRCEWLPVMDSRVLRSAPGGDYYCSLEIGHGTPLHTEVKAMHGPHPSLMRPTFDCEMWYPVSIPSTAQVRTISSPTSL